MGYVCVGVSCCVKGELLCWGTLLCWGMYAMWGVRVLGFVCCVGVCAPYVCLGYVCWVGTYMLGYMCHVGRVDTSASWPEQGVEHLGRSLLMGPAWPPDSQPHSAEQLT